MKFRASRTECASARWIGNTTVQGSHNAVRVREAKCINLVQKVGDEFSCRRTNGPKVVAARAESGSAVIGRGSQLLTRYRVWGSATRSPTASGTEPRRPKVFFTFQEMAMHFCTWYVCRSIEVAKYKYTADGIDITAVQLIAAVKFDL